MILKGDKSWAKMKGKRTPKTQMMFEFYSKTLTSAIFEKVFSHVIAV